MAQADIFSENDRLELIEGKVVTMSPIGSYHAGYVKRLNFLFGHQIGDATILSVQDPIMIDEYSEPVPDLALLRPRDDFYTQSHPTPNDVLLVVEVSDTSEEYDRNVKLPMYAQAGIPEVWLVNVSKNLIEVYSHPLNGVYQDVQQMKPGYVIEVQAVPNLTIAVEEVLG